MPGVQSRIDKDGSVYYDRKELLIYVLNLQDEALAKNPDSVFWMKKAVDGSHIYYINGKVVGRERPGIPEYSSGEEHSGDSDEEEYPVDDVALVNRDVKPSASSGPKSDSNRKERQKRARLHIKATKEGKKKIAKMVDAADAAKKIVKDSAI